ncbi:hypothetical protein ACYRFS_12855 [Listeria kieliensis]
MDFVISLILAVLFTLSMLGTFILQPGKLKALSLAISYIVIYTFLVIGINNMNSSREPRILNDKGKEVERYVKGSQLHKNETIKKMKIQVVKVDFLGFSHEFQVSYIAKNGDKTRTILNQVITYDDLRAYKQLTK